MQSYPMKSLFVLLAVLFLLTGCAAEQAVFVSTSSDLGSEIPASEPEEEAPETEKTEIYVYVCGEVSSPGVYRLPPEARVYEAVAQAGGLTKQADAAAVNQARELTDGEEIYVPALGEAAVSSETSGSTDGKININTADAAQLTALEGIGESKAAAIIAWREENGGFSTVEDLLKVNGIAEKTFEKIKDEISVN